MALSEQLQPGEEILHVARPSRIVLLPPLALAVLLGAAAVAGWRFAREPWPLVAGGVPAFVALGVAGVREIKLRSQHYVLTNHRVLRQTGIWTKTSMDTYLDKINNVEHRQTFWGRIFHFGDVEIDTASGTGHALFQQIGRPLDWKRAIVAAAEAYRGLARPGAASAAAAPAAPASGAERLRQLKALLDDGLISPGEYEAKRKLLLEQL
jgi:uncharacterized membrane protein YdbT with pleckstrin-like domain